MGVGSFILPQIGGGVKEWQRPADWLPMPTNITSADQTFVEHPTEFDGATIVKDLVDIGELDLDAMVHDYDYINGANRNFIKKWKADIKYIKNMERNGKGIRIFRLLLLTIIGIIFVPYCFIKYKIIK